MTLFQKLLVVIPSGGFVYIKLRNEEMLRVYPSLLHARKFLGWKSNISFERVILKTINFYNKNKVI